RRLLLSGALHLQAIHSFPTRRASDLGPGRKSVDWRRIGNLYRGWRGNGCRSVIQRKGCARTLGNAFPRRQFSVDWDRSRTIPLRSEEHTSELQSLRHLVCRLLLEKKK